MGFLPVVLGAALAFFGQQFFDESVPCQNVGAMCPVDPGPIVDDGLPAWTPEDDGILYPSDELSDPPSPFEDDGDVSV